MRTNQLCSKKMFKNSKSNALNVWFDSIRAQSFLAFHWLKASALLAVKSNKKLLGRNFSIHPTDCISKAKLAEKYNI